MTLILAALLGLIVGAVVGVVTMAVLASGARADECHGCPDRRAVDALASLRERRGGTDE